MRRQIKLAAQQRSIPSTTLRSSQNENGGTVSPLLGALYLRVLDERLGREGVYYVRYMDDILVLTRTRWQLRHVVRTLNQAFAELKVSQHPEKTFIGRIERGFDFLGYYSRAARYGLRDQHSRNT